MNVNPVFPFNAHYLSSIVLLDSRLVRTSDQPARQATSRECSHNYGRLATDRLFCFHSDERHPRPGKKSKTDDEDRSDEEDLNEANYDEVTTHHKFIIKQFLPSSLCFFTPSQTIGV